jgi:hypothetical protein
MMLFPFDLLIPVQIPSASNNPLFTILSSVNRALILFIFSKPAYYEKHI